MRMTHVIGGPVWTAGDRLQALASFILFLVFSVAGGIAIGAFLGAVLGSYRFAGMIFGIAAVLLVSRDVFRLRIPLPQIRLQVPEGLKTRRGRTWVERRASPGHRGDFSHPAHSELPRR